MPKTKGRRPQPATMTADEFRAILSDRRMTQVKAAELLGVSRLTVNEWATGKRAIRHTNVAHIRQVILHRSGR